jgi:predicted molibdopterin-dependent oxidoreductase YjgC
MFKPLPDHGALEVRVIIDGAEVSVPQTFSVAAAVLAHRDGIVRTTPVTGALRAPYCLMGVCFDCLVEIDGVPNQQGCLAQVRDGMRIERQLGKCRVRS